MTGKAFTLVFTCSHVTRSQVTEKNEEKVQLNFEELKMQENRRNRQMDSWTDAKTSATRFCSYCKHFSF